MHQGDIWIESDVEKGSTFIFAIPLKKPVESRKANEIGLEDIIIEFEMNKAEALSIIGCSEDLQEEIELPEIYPPEKKNAEHGLVLVVDDDKNSNELLSTIFKETGYSVASLYGGKNVLNVAKRLKPSIIVLDVSPGGHQWMACFEAAQK